MMFLLNHSVKGPASSCSCYIFAGFFLSVDTPKPSIEIALVSAIFSRVAIRVTWESKILLNVQAMRTQ